jgi:hypothetical protein
MKKKGGGGRLIIAVFPLTVFEIRREQEVVGA